MFSFSIELLSTEKLRTGKFEEISLCSSFVNSCETLPKQRFRNLCYPTFAMLSLKFVNFCFVYK